MKKASMKPRPTPPKDRRVRLTAQTVDQLKAELAKLPGHGKVYVRGDTCDLAVRVGNQHLAEITLTGY